MDQLLPFLLGVVATASAAVGTFFYRFWRRTHERLFIAFAAAFWLMSANWTIQAFVSRDESYYAAIYLLRLAAFGVIIVGVIGKNRRAKSPPDDATIVKPAARVRQTSSRAAIAGVVIQHNGRDATDHAGST